MKCPAASPTLPLPKCMRSCLSVTVLHYTRLALLSHSYNPAAVSLSMPGAADPIRFIRFDVESEKETEELKRQRVVCPQAPCS